MGDLGKPVRREPLEVPAPPPKKEERGPAPHPRREEVPA